MPEERLTLIERRSEYPGADTYVFKSHNPIPYEAGQYAHVRLFGMPPEEKAVREFSFASAPHEKSIWFGVAASESPYQKKLRSLEVGDEVGIFKIKRHMLWPPVETDVVMIAGGIGITPFRSFLADRAEKKIPIRASVIHAGNGGFLYEKDISKLADEYLKTGRERFPGVLSETAHRQADGAYYVAGSPGFVDSVVRMLRQEGVTRIESDTFKGLAE